MAQIQMFYKFEKCLPKAKRQCFIIGGQMIISSEKTHTQKSKQSKETRTKCLYQCNGEDGCLFT